MTRRTAGRVAKPRLCAFCGDPMPAAKPVYLVTSEEGSLIGPYHSGCAEKLVLAHKGQRPLPEPRGEYFGYLIPPSREETLPW